MLNCYFLSFLLFCFGCLSYFLATRVESAFYSEEMGVVEFFKQPGETLVQALLLRFRPLNMDVLPLYIVLMAFLPLILWLIKLRADIALALSVVLIGLLMMVTRRNAVSQVVGFMSLENGLILAATGAKGMPLVVEVSVAFSILIAFIVFGVFVFRMRERFDTVDVSALDRFRGERSDLP